jgi:hypothetical protein
MRALEPVERPAQAGCLHPRQILVDRALTHVGAARNLPLAELLLEVQPQDLLDLSHGLSLSGQLRSALLGPINHHPRLKSSAAVFPFSRHSDHCSPLSITPGPGRARSDRLQRRTLIAFTGEH